MNNEVESLLLKVFKAKSVAGEELIQNLWSNYGQLLRIKLNEGKVDSVIIKNIITAQSGKHPRGWDTNISHARKVRSYEVETNWYNNWSARCNEQCRVPKCYLVKQMGEEQLIVLEDLNESGFPARKTHLSIEEAKLCLKWLANFHATFLNEEPKGLWEIGTYWHLSTRPDEFKVMEEGELKQVAHKIDDVLNKCKYKTFVHGDAKVANFCFDNEGKKVAAVDFQYVGGGCGMKDVAYLFSSCLTETECETHETELLDFYFSELKTALSKTDKSYNFNELEIEWRGMYAYAWVDFIRFLKGWSPTHQKVNSYSKKIVNHLLSKLNDL